MNKSKQINIKEELKAWLGFNVQDLLMNISTIPFLLGFITKNIYICIISFAIAFMFMTSGLIIYLIKKNTKISKFSRIFNKYSSIIIYILFIFVMILKLLMYYVIPNKIWYLKSSIDKQVVASSDKRTDCEKYIKGQVVSSVFDSNYYILRKYNVNSFQEDYLVELCNPEDQNQYIIMRKENLINNKT